MTEKEIKVLAQACQMAGIDANKIKPSNPFEKTGSTAKLLQAAVSEVDPAMAAKWRVESGSSISVATLAEMQSVADVNDFSRAAKADLYEHDPDFVREVHQQQEDSFAKQLEWMEAETDRMRRKRYGDKAVDADIAKATAEQEARAESLKRHNDLQRRIDARRAQTDAMAGRFN